MRFYHLTTFVAVASTTTLVGADECQQVFDLFGGGGKRSHCNKADGNCHQLRVQDNGAIHYGGTEGKPLTCDMASELIGHKSPPAAAAHSLSDFGAVGIHNIGNTCYMNSAIQILGHLIPFAKYFIVLQKRIRAQYRRKRPTEDEKNVMNGFIEILRKMYSAEHVLDEGKLVMFQRSLRALRPEEMRDVFEEGEEADASEALQAMVQILSEISKKYPPETGLPLEHIFEFTQVETIRCEGCDRVARGPDTRTILNGIFTDKMRRDGDVVNLIDTIKAHFVEERVQRDLCIEDQCAGHGFTRYATKRTSIQGAGPDVLLVGLQRKVYDGRRLLRINNFVQIPELLDLGEDLRGIAADGFTGQYELVGIIDHGGSADGGHYIAKFRNILEGKWYEANDSRITRLADGPPELSQTAVLFVYQKLKTP